MLFIFSTFCCGHQSLSTSKDIQSKDKQELNLCWRCCRMAHLHCVSVNKFLYYFFLTVTILLIKAMALLGTLCRLILNLFLIIWHKCHIRVCYACQYYRVCEKRHILDLEWKKQLRSSPLGRGVKTLLTSCFFPLCSPCSWCSNRDIIVCLQAVN